MTTQIPDLLYHESQLCFLDGKISALDGIPEVERPKFDFISTACWRGYVATWIIDNGCLKLQDVNSQPFSEDEGAEPPNILYQLYPNHDSLITAFWVNGEIEAYYGEATGRCRQFQSVHQFYRVFTFESGKLTKVIEHDDKWWREKNQCDEAEEKWSAFLKNVK